MRVLHVINSLAAGGAERLVSELLPSLRRMGVDSSLLVLDRRNDVFSEALEANGIHVRFSRGLSKGPYSPARLEDIFHAIRRYEPDVLHAHLGPSFHWCAIAKSICTNLALVATEHASENRRMSMPLLSVIEKRIYMSYDRIAVVSEESGEALRRWIFIPRRRLKVIPNGIDLVRFMAPAPASPEVTDWLAGRFGVAMTARLVEAKDHDTALRALSMLPRDICLVLIGDGPEGNRLRKLAVSLKVNERCLFLGARNDVPRILAACGAYLQSSRVEGFGIAALEAMAAGLPVVASMAPGLGPLVQGAGLSFPVGDPASCATAVLSLAEDRSLSVACAASGRKRADGYSIERCADAYKALYEETLRARS